MLSNAHEARGPTVIEISYALIAGKQSHLRYEEPHEREWIQT